MGGNLCALLWPVSRRVAAAGGGTVAKDDRRRAPPQGFVLNGMTPTGPMPSADAVGRVSAEPSWGRVLATTVKLHVQRLRRHPTGSWPWRLVAALAALAVIAAAAVEFTGAASVGTKAPSAGNSGSGSAYRTSSQAQAAAWIAGQVSSDAMIACYPAMCTALQEQGVAADRLLPWQPGSAGPIDADVVVTSTPASSQLADDYAPALIASFGSGVGRIEVRATEPGGAAAYEPALQADLAARRSAGSELLRNWHIRFTVRDAAQLRAGEVDTRLLATLAALASQYSFRVAAFGDVSPGVRVLFREATITAGGGNGAAELAGAMNLVNEQDPPFLPTRVATSRLAAGQAALSIEFAAPDPLGLLTPTLQVDRQRAAARMTMITGALPLGWARTS
jgi:hypothetical protein